MSLGCVERGCLLKREKVSQSITLNYCLFIKAKPPRALQTKPFHHFLSRKLSQGCPIENSGCLESTGYRNVASSTNHILITEQGLLTSNDLQ